MPAPSYEAVRFAFGVFLLVLAAFFGLRGGLVFWRTGRSPIVAFTKGKLSLELLSVIGLLAWLGLVVRYVARGPFGPWLVAGPANRVLHPLGLVAMALACIVLSAAIFHIGSSWRIGIDEEHTDRLVTEGVYARVRHPIYGGLQLAAAGVFLLAPNAYFAIALVGIVLGTIRQALAEEAFLARRFGEAYGAYVKRSGRFLPRLRRHG